MVFMVRLIPGFFLIFLCALDAAEFENDLLRIKSRPPYTTNRNKTRQITDEDVENIVKPYKFGLKNADNSTSIKLQQSESYTTKRTENSRIASGRSVDIDIEKYISPDFHNAVHTNTKNYASEEKTETERTSFEKFGQLTTPKTPFFDEKYKETVDSVDQKLEIESPENDFENFTQTANYSADNFIEELDKNPNVTKYEYKNSKKMELNETRHPNGQLHGDLTKETRLFVNFESQHNRTNSYNERKNNDLRKENVKYLIGDENVNDVKKESLGTNLHLTTKKYSITKPPTEKADTGIISNKIESETLKYLPETTTTKFRGSIKFADYQKSTSTTSPSSHQNNRSSEQVVQENQIVPIHVIPPTISKNDNTETTPGNSESTTIFDKNETIEPEEQQSTTILVFIQPNDSKYETTTGGKLKTTIASTPRGFQVSPTTENFYNTETTLKIDEETTIITTTDDSSTIETTPLQTTTYEEQTVETTTFPIKTTTFQSEPITTTNAYEETTMFVESITTETQKITTTLEPSTKIFVESTPTKTLLENQTTLEKSTPDISTTSIGFVHIKTVDKNHTTLLPDILGPNEVYTTPTMTETRTSTTTESVTTVTTTTDEAQTTHSSNSADGPGGGNGAAVAIVISCVGGICLIALASLLIVMRNRQKRFNYGQRCRPVSLDDYSVDNVSVFSSVRRKTAARTSKRSYGNPAFEDPVCLTHPLNFPAISKFAANEEEVHAEFGEIPQIIARTSELPEGCETKNRYANVIPLPESRVFLSHIEGYPNSDYINANFVTGPKNVRKYYIACQAPMSNTVDDFWRMIWEHQCKVILMLTHLFENGVEKCYDYLPPSEVLDCHRLFGDFQVTLKKREVKEKYIISSIQLKNMVSNSWREVTHFWYMGWPEKGVPSEANSIIAFLIEARSFMKSATIDKKTTSELNGTSTTEINPVVVHCSPGTGRTGVVITCDIAIREFEQTRQVDIPKILYKIRRDRASAVQTKDQYAFIYKVVDLYATKLAGGGLESI